MAFQTRSRNPLLDSNMQAAIEKRGKELIGLLLIGVGLLVAAIIGSYTPDDSNWMVSTDAPVQNMLGQTGATIAFLLITFLGKGSWAIAVFLFAWGTRFLLHKGEGRILWPALMLVFWLIVVALHFETLVPDEEWRAFHNSGLGGMIGNTALGGLLALLPFGLAFLVKSLSFLTAVAMIALGAFVLGFSRDELKRIGRFLLLGVLLAYDMIARLLGRSASGGLQAARTWQHRRAERRAEVIDYEDDALVYSEPMEPSSFTRAEPQFGLHAPAPAPQPQPAVAPVVEERGGLLSRATNLIRRAEPVEMPEPELIEQQPVADVEQAPGDERIAQKIANAVRIRRAQTTPPEPDPNLPLTKGRGKRPEPLIFNAPAQTAVEPPISAPAQQIPTAPTITSVIPQAPTLEDTATSSPDAFFVDEVPTEDLPEEPVATMPSAPVEEAAPRVQITPRADPAPAEHAPVERAAMNIPVAEPRKAVVEQPQRKPVQPSTRAKAEAQPNLFKEDNSDFELPPLSLLTNPTAIERHHLSDEALEENARMLETVLDDYGVKGEIVSVRPGPVVTMYELEPAPGLKASRVIGLADDIARSMSALSARVSTVPGRTVIGIELPNENREKVVLREILASRDFGDGNQNLPLALGKDIGGDSMVANLAKMPHLLIAGTTGSGKSVAINTMILSLLYKLTPEECRLIMIDPKMLELSVYDGIPHLLSPVVTDPKKAVVALKWVVGEMEDRYRKMSKMGVRNIAGYNGRVSEALAKGEMFSRTVQTGFDDDTGEPVFETEEFEPKKLPYIVVIVDEMADLMMVAGKEIEACIQRLAQMARASGIHLIMATQRPSVDVITGTIKANFPTRISFQVTSKVDSRTILGEMGAEQLLGMGDMLYMAGGAKITRCHGPFVSDEEVEEVVNHLKQFGPPDYVGGVLDGPDDEKAENIDAVLGLNTGGNTNGEDALYDQAVGIVIKDRKCSTSYIQRKLGIGYNKAARLVEQMEEEGLVSAANHVGKREILVPEQ
ncbi:DNA translocase FtsK [Tritonibacter mobilis]|uniref:DNA translocase FtsK n=1 Tax=Tritonibacter mobilis F1926 TaxID=1265309 RepID=A0A1B0ZY06_9RHOB|nr:DNA translocase FtsK [Tritonibacter mobilis]ANP39209.1 cell division protein FtsK [Tritonibacter mobilis F1926]KJZ24713.1 cell division protein FtsK [Tritonibacter mobilis]